MASAKSRFYHFFVLSLMLACSAQIYTFSELKASRLCEISIKVEKVSSSTVYWKSEQEKMSNTSSQQLNLTTSDLQEALLSLNTTVFHSANNCVEVVISQGSYSINQSVYLTQNVRIIGEVPGEVYVNFNGVTVPQNASFYNVITVFGSEFVEFRGINFQWSPGIIAIERVTQVAVTNCNFNRFSSGALDIYQCFLVRVHNCNFANSGEDGVLKPDYQYRGHAGGLSIGFDDNHYDPGGIAPATVPDEHGIFVSKCVFRNNTSDPRTAFTSTELLQLFVFSGRGGAVAITINSSFPMNATLTDCLFEDNNAVSFGGGLYLGYSGYAAHTTIINTTVFARNRCIGPSGALQIGFIEGADNGFSVRLELYNSDFYDNRAVFGGAIHLFANRSSDVNGAPQLSQVAFIKNCTFIRNSAEEFGAAVCLNSLLFLVDTSGVAPIRIEDCLFTENFGGRAGVLSTAYLPLSFDGTNIFNNNSGRVVVISGTRADVHGSVQFISNDADGLDSGALYITSFGQLQFFSEAELIFKKNSGVLGASLVVEDVAQFSGGFSRALFNPLCVFRSENITDSPNNWNVKVIFSRNTALIASAVFLSESDLCSWISETGPDYFDDEQVFHWSFVEFTNDSRNTAHYPQETNPLWYVQSQPTSMVSNSFNVSAYPGQVLSLNVTGIDEFRQPVTLTVRVFDESGDYQFSPSTFSIESIQSPNIHTTYSVISLNTSNPKAINVGSVFTDIPLAVSVIIAPLPCPVGYILRVETRNSRSLCECNAEGNTNIQNCEALTKLRLNEGLWGVESPSGGENGDRLTVYPCPQHYCQCLRLSNSSKLTCEYIFNPEQPNDQCFLERKGVLCGECADGSAGFSALLNNCKSCGTINIILVFVLLLLDVIIIGGVVLLLRKSLDDWLYPPIFYLQIIPYVAVHFPVTFEVVHPYVYYLSSALSFYYLYDFCLGPQFSALLLYFIKLLPSLVTILVAVPLILIRYCSEKTRYSSVPGLWLVVLLQYTHVVHTCMSILNCPMLPGHNGVVKARWYVNGNIDCFTGGHIPLALLSIAVLLLTVILIPSAVLFSILRSKKHSWLYNVSVASSDAFKKKYAWWGVLELLRRVIILLFLVALPRMEYWTIFFLVLLMGVYLFVQPYKSSFSNFVEGFLAANLLVMLCLHRANVFDSDVLQSYIELQDYSNNNSIDSAVHIITINAIVLAPFYYVPVVVFIVVTVFCIVKLLIVIIKKKSNNEEPVGDTNSYLLYTDSPNVTATTSSIEISDHYQVPLSRIVQENLSRN